MKKGFGSYKEQQAAFANMNRPNVMNGGLQIHNIKGELNKRDIDTELFDVDAHLDSKLFYPENRDNILEQFKHQGNMRDEELDTQGVEFEIEQATDFHQSRSELSQEMDERKKAQTVITEKQIAKKLNATDKWYEKPNKSDIQGVDD